MFKLILSFLGGPIVKGLIDGYKIKLESKGKTEQIAADLAGKEIEAEIAANARAHELLKVEQGVWYTAIVRPLFALAIIIYVWKVVVWDKVLGWGTTDPLTGMMAEWAGIIITAYFVGRSFEKISRMILGRR